MGPSSVVTFSGVPSIVALTFSLTKISALWARFFQDGDFYCRKRVTGNFGQVRLLYSKLCTKQQYSWTKWPPKIVWQMASHMWASHEKFNLRLYPQVKNDSDCDGWKNCGGENTGYNGWKDFRCGNTENKNTASKFEMEKNPTKHTSITLSYDRIVSQYNSQGQSLSPVNVLSYLNFSYFCAHARAS